MADGKTGIVETACALQGELEVLKRDGKWKGQAELMGNRELKERLANVKAWLDTLRTTLEELGE